MKNTLKIAMIGQKGVPAVYSGVERHVEEISVRLAKKGHSVTVFCRPHYTKVNENYRGVRLKHLPSIHTKHLDAITHSFLATLETLRGDFDIIHYHALGPSTLSFLPKLAGKKVVVTVHGIDWLRPKWGFLARKFLLFGEMASILFPHRTIVVSKNLKKYFEVKYGREVSYIPNGINIPALREPRIIKEQYGLGCKDYLLFVGRLVPDKGCHYLLEAFKNIDGEKKLVVVGGSAHAERYERGLKLLAEKDDRILFTGYLNGETLEELYSNTYLFILPSLIEGLSVSLLEALSYSKAVLCSDIEENKEVLFSEGNSPMGFTFKSGDPEDLRKKISYLLKNPEKVKVMGEMAKEYVVKNYTWDMVAEVTEALYMSLMQGSSLP